MWLLVTVRWLASLVVEGVWATAGFRGTVFGRAGPAPSRALGRGPLDLSCSRGEQAKPGQRVVEGALPGPVGGEVEGLPAGGSGGPAGLGEVAAPDGLGEDRSVVAQPEGGDPAEGGV